MAERGYQPLQHQVTNRLAIIFRGNLPITISDDGDIIRIESYDGKLASISRVDALNYRHPLINQPGQSTATWNFASHYFKYVHQAPFKRCTGMLYPYLIQPEYESVLPICHLLSYLYNHKGYYKLMREIMRHGNMKFLDRCLAHIIMTPDSTDNCVVVIKSSWDVYIEGALIGKLGTSGNHISSLAAYQLARVVAQNQSPVMSVDDWSSDSDSAMSDDERFTPSSSTISNM